jgi:hypothetical protein
MIYKDLVQIGLESYFFDQSIHYQVDKIKNYKCLERFCTPPRPNTKPKTVSRNFTEKLNSR